MFWMVLEVAESLGIQHVAPANWPMETCSSISLLSPHSPPWGSAHATARDGLESRDRQQHPTGVLLESRALDPQHPWTCPFLPGFRRQRP